MSTSFHFLCTEHREAIEGFRVAGAGGFFAIPHTAHQIHWFLEKHADCMHAGKLLIACECSDEIAEKGADHIDEPESDEIPFTRARWGFTTVWDEGQKWET